ncbi:DUF4906 domain-containing protein [Bacteroides timonensis]|uniref:DUF4906 domain-containing protein n=1 Tax=Bacteroides timonensis TaxID=1470345 RepID=UPI001FCC5AF1|nr:DUF4906 domain-containing protein [Bacteroides timonensis]
MNRIMTAFCVVLMLILTACESSVSVDGVDSGISIYMTSPPALSVDTRAGSISGVSISDVWVMQFNAEGKKLHAVHFSDDKIKDKGTTGALVEVETSGFSNVKGTFRIIVNFGGEQSGLVAFSQNENATLTELEQIVVDYTNYQNNPNYLISDNLAFEGVGTDGKAVIMAPLNYAYVWLDVKWANKVVTPARFTLQSIKAYNLPSTLALATRAGAASGVYPESASNSYTVASSGGDNASLATGSTYTFYMPENLRGMGCGKSFQEKNLPDYGPKADGTAPAVGADGVPTETNNNLAGCTYIDLEGLYWYSYDSSNPTATSPISVHCRLYLGGNLINDYNIRRGYHYTITAQISGANSADVRVTITNGNVVVFDDVEPIEKTVEFK